MSENIRRAEGLLGPQQQVMARLRRLFVPRPVFGRMMEPATMTLRYAVGIKVRNKTDQMTVEAEDALIAALKVKTAHPEAAITYVRKRNVRGDRRHPHSSEIDEDPAERKQEM